MVPSTIDNRILTRAAEFRSKGRIPVLVYRHASNKAAIIRAAQPMSGLAGLNRSEYDEALVSAAQQATPNASFIYVIDARPQVNAVANQAKGAGYINTNNYYHCRLAFMGASLPLTHL